jgi:hypothetical protein
MLTVILILGVIVSAYSAITSGLICVVSVTEEGAPKEMVVFMFLALAMSVVAMCGAMLRTRGS